MPNPQLYTSDPHPDFFPEALLWSLRIRINGRQAGSLITLDIVFMSHMLKVISVPSCDARRNEIFHGISIDSLVVNTIEVYTFPTEQTANSEQWRTPDWFLPSLGGALPRHRRPQRKKEQEASAIWASRRGSWWFFHSFARICLHARSMYRCEG